MKKDEKDYSPYCPHCTACGIDSCCSAMMCSPDHAGCQYGQSYMIYLREAKEDFLFSMEKLEENAFFDYRDVFEKVYDDYIKVCEKSDEIGQLKAAYRADKLIWELLDSFNYFDKTAEYFLKDED